MHILLVRFSSMGDVVLQTATINWLRSLLGDEARFTFVTSSEFVCLVENHPQINRVIGLNRREGEKWKDFVKKIDDIHSTEPIDLILDLHATLRSLRLKFSFWRIPALTVDKRRWERFLLTKIKNPRLKKIFNHKIFGLEVQAERILNDFQDIFLDHKAKRRTIEYRQGPHEELTSLGVMPLYQMQTPYLVIAPSASFIFKRWPVQMFVDLTRELLEKTTFHVVILAGPEDTFCDVFNSVSNPRLHNLQGRTSLKQSMSLLSKAELCIGNDSGMNHIAEAYGVKSLTIFGPTDPRFGFAPHGNKSRYLYKGLFCSPCSTTGKKACYREKHFCMEEISVSEVLAESLTILGQV